MFVSFWFGVRRVRGVSQQTTQGNGMEMELGMEMGVSGKGDWGGG
jgi:hypothetical protein